MVVFCQALVSDIFICCQAQVLDTDPTLSCTVTADTDAPADDQRDMGHIVENTMEVVLVKSSLVKLIIINLLSSSGPRHRSNTRYLLIHRLMINETPSVI